MNKQSLIQKMAENLGVSRTQKDLAFKIFINKVTNILNYGEALKIPEIGIFQLKKGSKKKGRNKETAFNKSSRIIFSPTYNTGEEEKVSLFLTINVDEQNRASEILDEKIFSLGVGKPLIPIVDNGSYSAGDTSDIYFQKSIQARIAELLSQAEKLENFDLWDDYLSRQRLTPSENVQPVPKDNSKFNELGNAITDLKRSEPAFKNDEIHENFEEESTKLNNKNIVNEESTEDNDNSETTNAAADNTESVSGEDEIEVPSEHGNIEVFLEESENIELNENNIIEDINELNENMNDEISNSSEALKDVASYSESALTGNDNLVDETGSEESLEAVNKIEEIIEEENSGNNDTSPKSEKPEEDDIDINYSKQTFWMLVIAFVLLGVIGIYYFFISSNNSQPAKIAVKKEIVNKPDIKKANIQDKANLPVPEKIENQPAKPVVEENVSNDKNNKIAKPVKTVAGKDLEVEDYIYFNGLNYSVQVSSWRKPENAKIEIGKLKKKGINASVVKADLGSRGIWYRVRIKNIKSLKEAQSIKNNLFGKK